MVQEKQIIYSFKIVIVGGPATGKTCLFNRFCFNSFDFDTSMTIGINFHSINLPIHNPEDPNNSGDLLASNSIFDFGGQERFKPLIPKFLKGADGALLVFDLINIGSLEQLDFWNDQLIEHAKGLEIPKILVGSKSDLIIKSDYSTQVIQDEMIQEFLRNRELDGFFKTSALENYNVVEVFKELTDLMLKKHNSNYKLL